MADILNLQRARKQKARKEKQALAEANRVTFGRTKAERAKTTANAALIERRLDGVQRTPATGEDDPSGTGS